MSAPEQPAVQPVSISLSSDHYVRLVWWDKDNQRQELNLNPGQALAVGGFANLAQQSLDFSWGKDSN